MFGKKNEETVGLLKVSANKLDGNTKYGTVEKNEKKKPTISGLFRYASKADVVLMSIGVICSVIHGSSFPVLALVFGQMTNVFIQQASVTSVESNSQDHIPLTVVGNVLDLIHTNPFNSTSNYSNYTNILHSSDVDSNSPLNVESSTLGAFFMSEMERLSTVKTITEMNLGQTTDIPSQSSYDGLSPEEFYNYMTKYSLYYIYIGCTVLFAAFIQTFCWEIACERQVYRLRKALYSQMLRQEISWYDLSDDGNLTTKLSDDLERIREGISSKFSMVTQYTSTLFTGILIGLCVNWRLTLIILCVTPFLVAVSGALAIISASTAAREQIKYGLAGSIAEEVLLNIRTVAAFGGELKESKRYNIAIEEGRKLVMKKYYVFSILLGSVFVIMYSAYGIAFWYGSNLIVNKISSPGSIFTVFFSVMAGAFSVGNALPFINSVSIAIGAASNIFNIIDNKPKIDPYSSQGKKLNKIQGKIEFKNVNFTYPTKCSISVLNNLSLTIEPGQTVALVGSSRDGKSTIGNLLLRFYDPTEGQVLLDNFDLKYLNLHWLRQNIGIVSQTPVLFGVSIAENIRYGQSDCTQQDIIAAAMTSNAHSFIIKLPKGYDTLIGDKGFQLSGDQKQRIVIARALVKDPKILLLEEATSGLDAESEDIIQKALDKAQQNRSTIILTHRLTTLRNVDIIFVLQDGCIVESGTHEFLMSKNGLYSNLFNTQVKQENNRDESLESDEDIMDESTLDNKNMNIEYATLSTSPPNNTQISLKPEIENVCMKDILKFNCPEWPWLVMGFIGCILTGVIIPVFSIFYGQVFATFTLKGDELLQEAAFWSKMFIILALLSGLAWWMQTFGFTHACEKLIMRIRIYAFENVLRQPVFWFDFKSSSPSIIISRLSREAPLVKSAGILRVAQVISAFVTLSAAIIIAFTFGWKFAIILVIGVPIIAGAAYKQLIIVQKSKKRDFEVMDKANRISSETISSIKTVQGLAQELMFVSQYENSLKDPFKTVKKQAYSFAIMYAVSQAVIYGMYSVSFRYGAYLVEIGDMSATDIYRVFFALAFCAASVGQTSAYLQGYSRAKNAASLIFQLIWRQSEIDPLSTSGSKPTIKGKVQFKDVKFQYPTKPNARVLQGINFIVEPGKTLAIVGESGCGKSTIVSLLERFYDPSKGVIEVDNHDIRAINLCHLRQNIGIVSQEPILFNSSVKDNIAYGVVNREVPMNEIIDVAKQANIHNFITTLAEGYNTLIGDNGSQLSNGQKQQVAIARALIRNPKILLLDEVTTALDTDSEAMVQGVLEAARKDRTCIIIAHRLSTIQSADSIAVIHNGKIVEQGNHEELKAKNKYYYKLITCQE
ncbi:ATP-dependent translocase ABCB1-like isoform X4 [Rhopalosiphum padi]|uniref:ATP-dependent translocase ABCB1-like isoform X4 n=1 Tax=Rhopalosiphum padi TaxID=40932 RepID=UPI00298E40B6|nr:ATP-dependent translocase ABCB1-like isoform X4 [Rhopalosiphum padi]